MLERSTANNPRSLNLSTQFRSEDDEESESTVEQKDGVRNQVPLVLHVEVVLEEAERAEVAAAPVYSMTDVVNDPHLRERNAIVEIDGVPMQNVIARLSATPGIIRFAARGLGADTEEVIAELDD